MKESATMRRVYSHSIMNISATGAADSTIGLFLDQNGDYLRAFNVLLSGSKRKDLECVCFDTNFWEKCISNAPLSKRAWVCQERLLSPRILHFGATQMSWECMELASCETFPERVPEGIQGNNTSVITKRDYFDRLPGFSESMWAELVQYYTSCALTFPSDRYIAFAGLVEEIHFSTKDEYIVGFWRKGIERQLLWQSSATTKPTEYRAPSWSWLSINSTVRPMVPYSNNLVETIVKVLDVRMNYSGEGSFGPVTYGCLRCHGILGSAVCQKISDWWAIQTVHGRALKSMPISYGFLDHMTDLSEHKVTYLPVLKYEGMFSVLGLFLKPTHVKEEEYRRVGIWQTGGIVRIVLA